VITINATLAIAHEHEGRAVAYASPTTLASPYSRITAANFLTLDLLIKQDGGTPFNPRHAAEQGTCPRRADPLAPICEIEMRSSDLACSVQISLLLLRRNQKLHYPEPHLRLSPTHQTE
jgi:hypothetical protein